MARQSKEQKFMDKVATANGTVYMPLQAIDDDGNPVTLQAKLSKAQLRDTLLVNGATNGGGLHFDEETNELTTE